MQGRADNPGAEEAKEARTQQRIAVREVTHFQLSWTEQERGAPGAFTLQLLLDHGADEYVLHPSAGDVALLIALLEGGRNVYFDRDRKVLMAGNRRVS